MPDFTLPAWMPTLLWTLIAAGIGALVGVLVDSIVLARLRHLPREPRRRVASSLAKALRGMPAVWGALIGVVVAKPTSSLPSDWAEWVSRAWVCVLILSITVFFARLASWLIRSYIRSDQTDTPSGTIFVNIARISVWAIGGTFALSALGVQIGPLVATLGVAGLAISLGLQDTLANLFNGLQLTLTRQVVEGDYIRLDSGEEGEVVDVNWRVTTILTPAGEILIAPNSLIGRSLMTKLGVGPYDLNVPFTVAVGTNLEDATRIAREALASVQRAHPDLCDPDFEPVSRATTPAAMGTTCSAIVRVLDYRKRLVVADAFVRELQQRFDAADISFARAV